MAASNLQFDVGLRNPNFKPDSSSDSELSSNYSDEEIKKTPKAPIPKKDAVVEIAKGAQKDQQPRTRSTLKFGLPSSKDLPHQSHPNSELQRPPRDSSLSSVSSQISVSSTSSTRNRKKRKKKKSSDGSPSNVTRKDGNPSNVNPKDGSPSNVTRKDKRPSNVTSKVGNPSNATRKDGSPSNVTRKDGNPSNVNPKDGNPSAATPKVNSQLAIELRQINFPLEEDYSFRLVCSKCLIKQKDGENAFYLKVPCSPCSRDQLALKRKSRRSWIKVRQRPPLDSGNYRICLDFQIPLPCKVNPCSFAHGEGEQLLWMEEWRRNFVLETFIQNLRRNNIVTSEQLADAKSKNKYIPGLDPKKDSSKPAVPTRSQPIPVSNSSQQTIPKQDSYSKISYITKNDNTPSFSEPVPSNDDKNFPMFIKDKRREPAFSAPDALYSQSAARPKQELAPLMVDPALKPIHVESWPLFQEENPLKRTHTFHMFCYRCFPENSEKCPSHDCMQNILAFAEKGTSDWLQVRERKRRGFNTNYVLCNSVTGSSEQCRYGKDNCTYAHNTIEQTLWNADKGGNFDLTKFLFSHSSVKYKIFDFSRMYGTSFSLICGICFNDSKQIVYKNDKHLNVCSGLMHPWNNSKVLFYHSEEKIIKKKTHDKINFYKMCFSKHCRQVNCSLAHSVVERDVWMLLRNTEITEEGFVELLKNCSDSLITDDSNRVCLTPCPYKVEVYCYRCYLQDKKMKHSKCGHSKESSGVVYLTDPGLKHIGDLPKTIPKNYNFAICKSMKNNKCQYKNRCTFAHSQEEIKVWQWMCYNNISKVDDVLVSQEKLSREMIAGSSSILQTSTPPVKDLPVPHYCQFCNVSYTNEMDWENHCATPEHNANVTYDEERQWNYREPPWNVLYEKDLKLCVKHRNGQCVYSNSLDMHNLCLFAHRVEELEEWKQRFEWRRLKADMAKNPKVKSYIDRLQEKYLNSSNPALLMSETLPNVQLTMDGEKQISSIQKKSKYTWTFTVTNTKSNLKMVALLHNKDRTYFTVSSSGKYQTLQVIPGNKCKLEDNCWRVDVTFAGKMYGSFSQRIVFDFGTEPWLFQDVAVEIGTSYTLERLQGIRDKASPEFWSPENREIVSSSRSNSLTMKYKKPVNVDSIVTHDVIATKLNRHNYVQKMHKLLYLEEFECQQKMSRYDLCGEMNVLEILQTDSGWVRSQSGTLFGELSLTDDISEDTDIGKMILTNCTSVYISFLKSSKKIYEVEIVTENNYSIKGYSRNKIYLSLSPQCIEEFGLKSKTVQKVEVQFQFNRTSFCLMHCALDNLPSIDIVFPDPAKNVLSQKSRPINCSSKLLNEEQLVAVKYVLGERAHFLCPFILNGAYGTGKTETLAQATMELLDTKPDCKILICTQCNSSANLYILKHLHEYMEKKKQKKSLLRTYYAGRHISTVPEVIRNYTLMTDNNSAFRNPQKEDIKNVRVVIATLENCYQLMKLQLKGAFTHIFVDEAAQEFECKILLPLTFATEDTYVVLAGDHHQMGVKIHSTVARQQGLGISIMQRLFDYYSNHPQQILNSDFPLHTLLIQNYRSVHEITTFISTCFYGITTYVNSEKTLSAMTGLKPLQFYAVSGIEAHSANSTSFYNEAEVNQVVDCVHNISSNWPSDLGPFEPKDVCVVSAYKDQVYLIRNYLRQKHRLFKQIVVEYIGNMPGKEFKVIIISTVRTCNRLDIRSDKLEDYCDETDEPDFFFNKKLLNTAMTRAKNAIITVGDPIALCAYGKCATIWRIYLNYCSRLCSVKPSSITYDFVRHEVNRLLSNNDRFSTDQTNMETQVELLTEQSKTSLKYSSQKSLNSTGTECANIKRYQSETELSQPVVTPRSETSRSANIKHYQTENDLSLLAITPHSVPSQPVTPGSVPSQPVVTPRSVPSQSVTPRSVPSQPVVTPRSDPSQPVVTPRSDPSQPVVTPRSVPAQPVVIPRSGPSQPAVTQHSGPSQLVVTQHSGPSQPVVTQHSGPSQPAVTPHSEPSYPTINVKSYQSKTDLSQPAVIPNPTTSKILLLNLKESIPLDYPISKMDSLFSAPTNTTSSKSGRINFSFPSVFAVESPTENPMIGLSVYKTDQYFIIGVHWPDLQSYVPEGIYDNAVSYERVLSLQPKQLLPNIPELYFTPDHTIGSTSCFMKIDIEGKLEDCSFHQTLIKPEKILQMSEIENYLVNNSNKKQLNLLNYLQEVTDRWCQLRIGNKSLHLKKILIDYPKCDRLLKEIFIQVHVQIVRFLSKVFPKTIPTAVLSFEEGPKLEHWKLEHVFDAMNSVLLLQPFLQGNTCQCIVFCKCLMDYIKKNKLQSSIPPTLEINLNSWQMIVNAVNSDNFEEAQNMILEPFYHYRMAVALRRLSDLINLEFKCSDNENTSYNPTFDPHVYFCKPGISFLDLLVQRMLVAAIHKLPCPVAVKDIQKVTKNLTENIKAKEMLEKEEFFKELQRFPNKTIEAQATIMSVTDSSIEILFPQLVSWSFFIELDMLGLRSTSSNICSLKFSQIEANVLTYASNSQNRSVENYPKKIESNQFTISIKIQRWQTILGYLRSKDFSSMKNFIQSTNSSASLKKELYLPDYNINREVHYCLDVLPYLNLQASVKIVEDQYGHCSPQVELLHLTPNVSLCLLHRKKPLECFFHGLLTSLSEYQKRLLTEVYNLAIAQHRSIILRDVTLIQSNQFWTFTIPLVLLKDYNISLISNTDSEERYIFPPFPNMICIRFSLLIAKNVKSTLIFHGYICQTNCSDSNVTVVARVTDNTHFQLPELQKQKCNIEIICFKPMHRSMADAILNLGGGGGGAEGGNPLARNIVSRQLKPVKNSDGIFSALEENEFIIAVSENASYSLSYLMHWFEDFASILLIRETKEKEPILICTPNENELDIIEGYLQMKDLLTKLNVIRVAAACDESSKKSPNGIFLHEKQNLDDAVLKEEMIAFNELFGNTTEEEDDLFLSNDSKNLSKADVILCTCSTSQRSVIRSVVSIKQMIIFNAHLCSELLALIPISYYNIEKLCLFYSSEESANNSIVHRILQTCPQTKMIFK